jgi:hypothetical protein
MFTYFLLLYKYESFEWDQGEMYYQHIQSLVKYTAYVVILNLYLIYCTKSKCPPPHVLNTMKRSVDRAYLQRERMGRKKNETGRKND